MRQLLSDFIDRTLHWRTTRNLETHLKGCPPCRLYVRTVEQTIVLYRKRPVVEVPEEVRGHLRDLLRDRFAKKGAARKGGGRSGPVPTQRSRRP